MGALGLILLLVFTVGPLYLLYLMIKDPYNTVVMYLFSWQYRMLRKIRLTYKWGQQKTPPDSYSFFLAQANTALRDSLASKPIVESIATRQGQAAEIVDMLQMESYVKHYFTQFASFSGIVYHRMHEEYRTGDYITINYTIEEGLKKILPIKIASNEKAFYDFMKFVYAGWFNNETGLYILDGRTKHHIGRAIYWICKRNSISSPEKVFSSFWGTEEKTVADWCRKRSREPHRTEQVDDEVFTILNK